MRMFDALPDADAPTLPLARVVKSAGVSENASSVTESIRRIIRTAESSVARAMFPVRRSPVGAR